MSVEKAHTEMEQDHIVLALPTSVPHVTMASARLLPLENLSQRIYLIREVRNAEAKEKSQRRLNNNNVIKHSQGPLVLSQGL